MFVVDDIQACEVDGLTDTDGITVTVTEEHDNMGFPRVMVAGPTPEAVIEFVRKEWGDEDPDWFAEYIVARVWEMPCPPVDDGPDDNWGAW